MSIHLDENGKVSATRALVFLLAVTLVVMVVADTFWSFTPSSDAFSAVKAVLVTLAGSIAVRAGAKNVQPVQVYTLEDEGDLVAEGDRTVGYEVPHLDEMGYTEYEEDEG